MKILKTDFFHVDPYPGNLAIDSDESLIYYDFGTMGEIKSFTREILMDIFYAVYEKDAKKIMNSLINLEELQTTGDMSWVFLFQKAALYKCNIAGNQAAVTRLVDTMTDNLRATRAEATDVGNAVLDGNFFFPVPLHAGIGIQFHSIMGLASNCIPLRHWLQMMFDGFTKVETLEKWIVETKLSTMRPNTMNNYSVVLDDFGRLHSPYLKKLLDKTSYKIFKVYMRIMGQKSEQLVCKPVKQIPATSKRHESDETK
ncbi:hypothetical protein L2E82_43268 [Cichorium intybus]|uniref:Uncharacterized protein n=1 Tax=Cichorium intybus TaxID=13427 RepID=A0ACB8ZNK3_CICIN|nr:hypothetical protein L2E82_43268 [Cichorium intybus]